MHFSCECQANSKRQKKKHEFKYEFNEKRANFVEIEFVIFIRNLKTKDRERERVSESDGVNAGVRMFVIKFSRRLDWEITSPPTKMKVDQAIYGMLCKTFNFNWCRLIIVKQCSIRCSLFPSEREEHEETVLLNCKTQIYQISSNERMWKSLVLQSNRSWVAEKSRWNWEKSHSTSFVVQRW